ncbi:MAG: calcium-binding protein [Okeania sp. SIO3I5]|uniref:calcium-binding protein n=1 Tax=Okeania sp. SIO3I5 TaxID=2607805 RepID=UPI0013B71CCA|nr:calcium-binding protein [Okeania sp. SIO3I5]NEQ35156.1 calcium-binding protein [Okeania sp. SIO3I5]
MERIIGTAESERLIGTRDSEKIFGSDGDDTLEGRRGFDHLFGGDGNDVLIGGQGRDRFNGGRGNDTLTGNASQDFFIFDAGEEIDFNNLGVDTITDFVPAQDTIILAKRIFTEISSDAEDGFSIDNEFATVTDNAATSDAIIVYDSTTGQLFYNANGSQEGFGDGGQFAVLENLPDLEAEDFRLRANPTPETTSVPAEIADNLISFTPSSTEEEIAAQNGPSIEIGSQTIYIGTWQRSSNNQDPIIASFDPVNPNNNWVRTDYETTGADGRGRGLFWDGDDLYAVFSVDGTQGTSEQDFRRAATDAVQSWLRSYGQGGGASVSVVARIDIDDLTNPGEMTDAAYLTALLSNGNSNTLTVTDLSLNADNNLIVEADSFFSPRNPDGSAIEIPSGVSSPFDYQLVITPDLNEVLESEVIF